MALIMVVDDEYSVRQVLGRLIRKHGHEIVEAESADAALAAMEERPAAVVFCDIQMPGRDGLWLTAELRSRFRETAVVLATAVSSVAPRISMQNGVLAYLVKPFARASVDESLSTALAWHTDVGAISPRQEDTPHRLQEWLDSLE